MKPVIDRLLKHTKIDPNGCWLWLGYQLKFGYGRIRVGKKLELAHRVAYQHYHGPIPDDALILHNCDVPNCVNPEHLHIGTQKDNMQEASQRGRIGGEARRHKLTWDQVTFIRATNLSSKVLAAKYGVTSTTINSIRAGITWKVA